MTTNRIKKIMQTAFAASALLVAGQALSATTVNLTAQRASATLPDGAVVPMWQLCGVLDPTSTAGSVSAAGACPTVAAGATPAWAPGPTITVVTGDTLVVNLTNNLPVPTSIVVLGQLGGGLGTPSTMLSPVHNNTAGITANSAVSNISSVSLVGTTVTVHTYAKSPHGLNTGDSVAIAGITAATGFNGGPFVVTVVDLNTFTYVDATATGSVSVPAGATASQILAASQLHNTFVGNNPSAVAFSAPKQGSRVRSFGTQVGARASVSGLTWTALKPGTYIYETGTLPSLEVPMGLYGLLVVTQAPVPPAVVGGSITPGVAYTLDGTAIGTPVVSYDSDAALLFSEIDPVQNNQVDKAAVAGTKIDANLRFNDPVCITATANNCFPAAVNYTPTYFLVNGYAFDRTAPLPSTYAVGNAYSTGNILVRLANAGSRTHIPAIVGQTMALVAEDGHLAPGQPKVQNEALLTAGKTYDALIKPATAALAVGATAPSAYAGKTLPIFDRQGSLSTGNQSDGGMQAYLTVAGGDASTPQPIGARAVDDHYAVPVNGTVTFNVKANDIGVKSVFNTAPGAGTLFANANGTFTYTAPATSGIYTFTYTGNAASGTAATNQATVSLTVGSTSAPSAMADTYCAVGSLGCTPTLSTNGAPNPIPNVASIFAVAAPGLLANDTDPANLRLVVDPTSVVNSGCGGAGPVVHADGSFTVLRGTSATCSFTYNVKNSQGVASAAATVNIAFPAAGSGLVLNVLDAQDATGANPLNDYRWTIQEDRTFKHDTNATPSLSARTLGTSFHRSHNPVVATGCWHTGPVDATNSASCGSGQQILKSDGTRGQADLQTPISVGDVVLDPTKHYYISVLPGDAQNPLVNAGGGPVATGAVDATGSPVTRQFDITKDCSATANDPTDPCGHIMGGVEVGRAQIAAKSATIRLQKTPLTPAQLSVFIYNDNNPTNGQIDATESGLGGFNIILVDPAGRAGDPAGQQTYDTFGMPLTNALLGRPGCPDDQNSVTNSGPNSTTGNLAGVIYTCPNDPNNGTPQADPVKYALAGHALIKNITPARYDVIAHPGAAREGYGEIWWQTETLEGTAAQDAFTGINEPVYFQEFGPPGFHTTIGFVQPKAATVPAAPAPPGATVTGVVTSQHMLRPSNVSLWDAGTYDLLASTNCRVALNDGAGNGSAVQVVACNPDGTFTLSNVQVGDYEVQVFDQWLDQIIQAKAVTVTATQATTGAVVPMPGGNIQPLSWFTQHDQNILLDDGTGKLKGIPSVLMSDRYRNGSMSNQTLTDVNGNGILVELFPLFNWYVSESDTTRFKQKQVNITVDGGGVVDATGPGAHLWSSKYPTGESSVRTETPGAKSYGIQGFVSQRNQINWIRTPYAAHENGGIKGIVVLASTRPYDDQRMDVQNIWEPLVPRVKVNLYSRTANGDGTFSLTFVDTTTTTSFDDFVNTVTGSDGVNYILGQDGVLRDPVTGIAAAGTVTAGHQVNLQCPGQLPGPPAGALPPFDATKVDPFANYTLGGTDQFRCYDGFHNWNQVQSAPYDGRYEFPSAAYVANPAHALTAGQMTAGQTLVSLPAGDYVVEMVIPVGYQVVKEEDKDILTGDAFVAPVVQQFGGLTNIFILPDQATLNNGNPNNPGTGDYITAPSLTSAGVPFQSDPTSNLGVIAGKAVGAPRFADCVGAIHRVPDFLSLYPLAQLVAPFAGMDRPLCDKKLVQLAEQTQASTNFFVYTEAPVAANATGIVLDDASAEFNAAAPDFGEKASVPFIPVSTKDFTGSEVSRTYSDQWGAYNLMLPSTWFVNPPTPSGYGPNMLVNCINDPGPIPDPTGAIDPNTGKVRLITDPAYNPGYSNFCYTNPFMPGQATYLDTPVLPIAAFAAGYNPPDCAYPDATPAISRVVSSAGFGPYLPAGGGTLTITALGDQDVPNPAYSGPFALTGPASQPKVTRHYGFGATPGTVTIGGVAVVAASWSDTTITANVPAGTLSGELVITAMSNRTGGALANPIATTDAVTVTIGGTAPKRVSTNLGVLADYATIQAAVDAATPGDLILVDSGTYNELVVMWKPVRLQGAGAASVIINAAKFPTSKLEAWRPTINQMFGVDSVSGNGVPNPQVDPLPTQTVTGGLILLEPTVLGTEEGAGITVLAKNPADPNARCNSTATSSYFDPTVLDVSGQHGTVVRSTRVMSQSNFTCAASRIDGLTVTGGDAGGGIYVNGWAHGLEIANNRIYGNAGAYNGGVRIGVPYLEAEFYPGQSENANGNIVGKPTLVNGQIKGFDYDHGVKIHHNAITKNGTVEAPLGGGGAGGGVSICTGTDGYSVDHNWICGNYSSADGGGVGHIGFSQAGSIADNRILYNQSFQQTSSVHGGGIAVEGESPIAGTLSLGSGSVTIERNVIVGNFAEVGHGGGVRLQQVNGADVAAFPTRVANNLAGSAPAVWNHVVLVSNVIERNEAGWSGGGISLADTLASSIGGGDVAHNDSTGSAGVLIGGPVPNTTGVPVRGRPEPAGISSELTTLALRNAFGSVAGVVKNISSPVINGVRISKNRSFYYRTANGNSTLCSANVVPGNNNVCAVTIPDQTTTGQCTGSPLYWDLGVAQNVSVTSGANGFLQPVNSSLTASTFAIAAYSENGNNTQEPGLDTVWCNGSRVVPELASVINPPRAKNLEVAATVDEGNNFISVRYGPLYGAVPAGLATTGADLAITKNDAASVVLAGMQGLVYTVTVANNGPQAVINARVQDTLPGSTRFVVTGWTCAAVSPDTCTFTGSGNSQRGGTVSLAPGASATFTLIGRVLASATGTMTNTAQVISPVGGPVDPVPSNNIASDTNSIVTPAGTLTLLPGSFGAVEVRPSNASTLNSTQAAIATFTNTTPVSMTLRAPGDQANAGAAVTIAGTNNVDFTIVTGAANTTCTSGAMIPSGGTCQVSVTFRPPTAVRTTTVATLRVYAQGTPTATPTAAVSLAGGTAGVPVTQAVKLFTSWTRLANPTNPGVYGTSTDPQTITVTNTTGAALTLSQAPAVTNVLDSQFAVSTTAPGTCAANLVLAANGTCTVGVTRVRPTTGATAGNATLTLTSAGPNTQPTLAPTQILVLTGT